MSDATANGIMFLPIKKEKSLTTREPFLGLHVKVVVINFM